MPIGTCRECDCALFEGSETAQFCGTCGHNRDAHSHSDPGCSECDCTAFSGSPNAQFCEDCGHAREKHGEETSAPLPSTAEATAEANVDELPATPTARPIYKRPIFIICALAAALIIIATVAVNGCSSSSDQQELYSRCQPYWNSTSQIYNNYFNTQSAKQIAESIGAPQDCIDALN